MTRIGINGFGRMGRLAFRAAWDWPDVGVVHINEVKGGTVTAAHLLEFDSVHRRWSKPMQAAQDHLTIDGRQIAFTAEPMPNLVSWEKSGVDIVLECSGMAQADFADHQDRESARAHREQEKGL